MRRLSLFIVLSGLVLAGTMVPEAAPLQPLSATIPAAALTHLDLTALDGAVTLTGDPSATSVSVQVDLAPPRLHNLRRPESADLSLVALVTVTDANVLRVSLSHARLGNLEATWTIIVPSRFSARVDAGRARVSITGLAAGVTASVDSGLGGSGGRLDVDVPSGPLTLEMGVGTIVATRRDAHFGSADVRAEVGDADLILSGHTIDAPHAPGPGHRIRLTGQGPDALTARVSVGDVTLKIG